MKAQLKFFIVVVLISDHSQSFWIVHSIAGKVRFRPAMLWILECRSIINQAIAGSVSSLYHDFSTITAFVLVGSYVSRPAVQDASRLLQRTNQGHRWDPIQYPNNLN